ncbi:MAG: beta-ketoacyl-ACP synthase II [Gammaproteobacteria bacterium AqS3]|nr:beta-ketoacyl-ACP synthase II [Gammaproteobacteria bacterium AqS3]
MRRVVITGYGGISPLGNNCDDIEESLRVMRNGIRSHEMFKTQGLRSQIAGQVNGFNAEDHIDRKTMRFMPPAAHFCFVAMAEAIQMAGMDESLVSNERTGLIVGSGGPSSDDIVDTADTLRQKGVRRVGPYRVTKGMSSMPSACLATPYRILGYNYSITSACATSTHCIGNAMELIQFGKQDIMFAGGGESAEWSAACMFDAMGALSFKYNDTPETASRPYDVGRDGFVMGEGAAILVLEALEHAQARGANILAEVVGYGASSDGFDMVSPSGEGAVRCMRTALSTCSDLPVDYINTHGTSTPAGDIVELESIREIFADEIPPISSTKSLIGHLLGGAGAMESLFCLLMMRGNFICGSANIETMDEGAKPFPIATASRDAEINQTLSNSFGFGGTNASLVFRRFNG